MKIFIVWIKEGGEHTAAFENSSLIRMGKRSLRGTWDVVRKIRLVRLIRKLIEEGIMVSGVKEIYEEGCRLLTEMERGSEGGEEEEDEEVGYMFELYLMKVRGQQKNMKKDEVEALRKEMEEERKKTEEEKRKREEAEKRSEEEKQRADEEKRKREESEKRAAEEKSKLEKTIESLKIKVEEMKKKGALYIQRPSPPPTSIPSILSGLITSLDRTSVEFNPNSDGIKKEGNTIVYDGEHSYHQCFIGGEMRTV